MKIKMVRPQSLAEQIVVIDGLSRSGKGLVAPILSSLDRGELWLTNHLYEYLCTMKSLGRIPPDTAETLTRLFADFDLYNLMISRYTNFRKTDETGVCKNLLEDRYLKRLEAKDGDVVVQGIKRKKPILILVTHYIFTQSQLLFSALGKRLCLFIETVRHPLWLVESWFLPRWDRRIGQDPREFQLSCSVNHKIVPWYAATWAEEYSRLNPLEQSIRAVELFTQDFYKKYDRVTQGERNRFLLIPFEGFSLNPSFYIRKIAKRMKTKQTKQTSVLMKKMKLPRERNPGSLEAQRIKIDGWIRKHAVSKKYRMLLDRLCRQYETRFANELKGLEG